MRGVLKWIGIGSLLWIARIAGEGVYVLCEGWHNATFFLTY
jgi:hypothetical protein